MKPYFLYLGLLCIGFCSCEKKEFPVPVHDPGNVITTSVDMGSTYEWQIYYDLETNRMVSKNLKTAWDLAFEASAEGFHVVLNSSKSTFCYNTANSVFESVTDTLGFSSHKRWDEPSGNLDSTAIGDWRSTNPVYIIDRGYNSSGTHLGFKKIQLLSVSNSTYTFKCGSLNNSNTEIISFAKNNTYNMNFFSFDNVNTVLAIEPPKDEWDMCFTQYTHVFYNPTQPYLVTGCITNRYQTSVAKAPVSDFNAIVYSTVESYSFSSNINTIGYDWKTFSGSTYITDPSKIYILKNRHDKYYKLHFIDFYNSSGLKGNPTWEYQAL